MADEIRADYNELEHIATRFNKQAQAIQQMQQKIRGSYGKLADKGWIGLGANNFFDEMESKVMPTEEHLQRALENAGQATQRIAQALKQAEEQASSLFRH